MEYDGKPVLYLPSGHDKVQQVQIKERSNSAPSKLTLEVQVARVPLPLETNRFKF